MLHDSIPVKYENGETNLSCDEVRRVVVPGRVRIGTRTGMRGLLGNTECSMSRFVYRSHGRAQRVNTHQGVYLFSLSRMNMVVR